MNHINSDMQKKSQYKVMDLFAGAGGFGLGFIQSGFNVFYSLEIDQWASDTLRQNNNGNMKIVNKDIKAFKSRKDIIDSCENNPNIIIGGPPCQGFSNAGYGKRNPEDPRNLLFKDFLRWVELLQPKIFIIENVRGLLTRKIDGYKIIDIINHDSKKINYRISIWDLNAAEYGIPQHRHRIFIVGNNKDINIPPPPKTHYLPGNSKKNLRKYINVKKAISDLPSIAAGEGQEKQDYSKSPNSKYQSLLRDHSKIIYNHVAMKHTKRIIERFKHINIGESVINAPDKYKERKRNGNGEISRKSYIMNNRRLDPGQPSYTIPASFYSSFIHPYLHRNLTAREAARIQSFPDCYQFMGKRTLISKSLMKKTGKSNYDFLSQYNQIGNAVPPLLAKAIADHVYQYL